MKRSYLALCVSILSAPALAAEDVDTSDWICEFCPFEDGASGDYDVGATSVSDDSAYFGNATGYGEEGVYANLDSTGTYTSEQQRVRWNVEDLGLDSRLVNLEGGKLGHYEYNFDWSELPYRQFFTTATVFTDAGNALLTLPDDWVRAPTTAGFTALDANLASRSIESDRQNLGLGGRYHISQRWSINAEYRQRNNEGVRMFGGGSFNNASQLPAPFDYTTDEVEVGVRWGQQNAFVGLSWYLSDFDSKYESLQWQQAFTGADGAESPAAAQPPDNRFQQLRLSSGYAFTEWRTALNLTAAIGQIEQNAAFLPYTTNANLSPDPLPRSSLDGQVDTTNVVLSVNSRPIKDIRLRASYRYDNRDNQTASEVYNRVIVDTFIGGPDVNFPYSYKRSKLALAGDWDALDWLRLTLGYERRNLDRTLQEVTKQEEDLGFGRARFRPTQGLEFDLRYGTSRRDNDGYNEALAALTGQNPLMRKYNMAYRFREFADVRATWSPVGAPLSFAFKALIADDSYSRSQIGLTGAEENSYAVDFNWFVSENASIFVNAGVENLESEQFNSESFSDPDWRATNDDSFSSLGLGFTLRNLGKFDMTLSSLTSQGETKIGIDSAAAGADQFPNLETDLDRVRLDVVYRRSETFEFNFYATYQRFKTADWALQDVTPDAVPLFFSLGAEPYDEENYLVGVGFRYRMQGN